VVVPMMLDIVVFAVAADGQGKRSAVTLR